MRRNLIPGQPKNGFHWRVRILLAAAVLSLVSSPTFAGDWPMWRGDAGRTASTSAALPANLRPAWIRTFPTPAPAWPETQAKLQFDRSYEPVVAGERLFIGSMVTDSITAYGTKNGEELWRYYTNSPVRFAPVVEGNRVLAVSDDGYLYCLDATTGKLVWKFNGGPTDRPIIGNHRLISSWPARGGVVVAGGNAYFTASIWPSMGIFVHAIDIATGKAIWTNSELGSSFTVHPHGASAFGSVVPQGYLALAGDSLIIPGGRTLPAVLDRATGKLKYFEFGGKSSGGYSAIANDKIYIVSNDMCRTGKSQPITQVDATVMDGEWLFGTNGKNASIQVQTWDGETKEVKFKDRKGVQQTRIEFKPHKKETVETTAGEKFIIHFKAGNRLYASLDSDVLAFEIDPASLPKESLKPVWSQKVEGKVWRMLAGDNRLFVVTEEGKLICFSDTSDAPISIPLQAATFAKSDDNWSRQAAKLSKLEGASEGIAVSLGIGSGRLIEELVQRTKLQIIAIDHDADRVDAFRRRMDAHGLYGTRVAAHVGTVETFSLPPYLANLIFSEDLKSSGSSVADVQPIFQTLRPYGGIAALPLSETEQQPFLQKSPPAEFGRAEVTRIEGWTLLKRVGALPGAGSWTHQYGDAGNSVVSKDRLVKAPLGVLWFGGPSNDKVLPRHGHGPSPQIAGGRLFIEGPDMIRAVDVYTGRVLWERELKGLGKFYDVTTHQSGAGEIGSNYVSLPDHLYVVYNAEILELDAATGATTKTFALAPDATGNRPVLGFVAVEGDYLVTTSSPVNVDAPMKNDSATKSKGADQEAVVAPKPPVDLVGVLKDARYASSSRRIVVFHRHSGKQVWNRDAEYNYRHNAIAMGNGTLFCIDGLPPAKLQAFKRRGIQPKAKAKLLALDLATGHEKWSTNEAVFGTFLNYSQEHDVLLQAGSASRDRAKDESDKGIVAYKGSDGKVLWKDLELSYGGPCLLWRDKIITNGLGGFQMDLFTGKKTGWTYSRMHGCNTAIGSENLLTFRSGAAGFCDLAGDSGTGNIGGYRSSCTSNLIAADGVLNSPDYTRTCVCSYQNQTSLALVYMPEAELWTFNNAREKDENRLHLGINLGAPGDRRTADGTLWLEYPSSGGPSPALQVEVTPSTVEWFMRHSSTVSGEGLPWVAASGGRGIETLKLTRTETVEKPTSWTVRLHFCEPDDVKPGERVFSVKLQGKMALEDFDIIQSTGGRNRSIVKSFSGIEVGKQLEIALIRASASSRPPVLCGVEMHAEGLAGEGK